MILTKHENETFTGQTVYLSGQAFIGCRFTACTLVLRESVFHLEGCRFDRCNWHIDTMLLWGVPESLGNLKRLINDLEAAQQQQQLREQSAREGEMDEE